MPVISQHKTFILQHFITEKKHCSDIISIKRNVEESGIGAFHYLLKPIDDKKFEEVLCKAVEEYRMKKQEVPAAEDIFIGYISGVTLAGSCSSKQKSNMTQKELLMLIMPSLSALAGYEVLRHYRLLYEDATGEYLYGIYGVYGVYDVHSLLYYSISFISILVMIIAFQNIKARQEEEWQKERLLEQIENMKSHILSNGKK